MSRFGGPGSWFPSEEDARRRLETRIVGQLAVARTMRMRRDEYGKSMAQKAEAALNSDLESHLRRWPAVDSDMVEAVETWDGRGSLADWEMWCHGQIAHG